MSEVAPSIASSCLASMRLRFLPSLFESVDSFSRVSACGLFVYEVLSDFETGCACSYAWPLRVLHAEAVRIPSQLQLGVSPPLFVWLEFLAQIL